MAPSVLREGFACRHRHRADGARQIFGPLLPGDICDRDVLRLDRWDHGVATLSPCRMAQVSRAALEGFVAAHPAVALALRRVKLDGEARAARGPRHRRGRPARFRDAWRPSVPRGRTAAPRP